MAGQMRTAGKLLIGGSANFYTNLENRIYSFSYLIRFMDFSVLNPPGSGEKSGF